MRVISGTARGKKLYSIEGKETRPTLDRVKESLFNIIQYEISDAVILDLFGGSGALGIEALSRGAKQVVFGDASKTAIDAINYNLKSTKFEDKAIVIYKDYIEVLKKVKDKNIKFDIIFLDPPYKSNFIVNSIKKILKLDLLAKDGIIISETDDIEKIKEIEELKNIVIYDKRKYGIAYLVFIRKG